MGKALRVLIIEDSEEDAQLLLRELQRVGYDVEFERVETAGAMQAALIQKSWDLILSDYTLPQFNAPKALEVLKASGLDLPCLIISGTIGEETAVAALKAGANDFLVKGKFARLGPAIERELREAETRREHRRAEEALRENERLLSEAQRIGHIGSWRYDIVTDTLQFSDEMYRLLDVSPQEFQHNRTGFLSLIYSADRLEVTKWMDNIIMGRQVKEMDFRIFHRSGELRYLQSKGAVIFDPAGKPARFTGTVQDITERKLAEIQIRQQIEHLNALRTIDQAITSSFNLRSNLDTVLAQTTAQLQVDTADVLLLDPEEQTLEYIAGRGFRTRTIENSQVPLGDSLAGRAAKERRLIQIENLKDQPLNGLLAQLVAEENFVCYYGVPLITKGKVKGVLEVFHRTSLQPYPEWIDFLETLAGQAAIAIENASLFENLERSNRELSQAYDATIEGWSHALDLRDKETEGHTLRVTKMALELARKFGFTEEQLQHIRWGALLHDIGKMGVPDSILLKPDQLTQEEWETMKKHPDFAFEMLSPIAYLKPSLDIPHYHHEKWGGTGYPRRLKGEEIPLAARLFAIVDVWDALRSDRPYRKAWTVEKAREYIQAQAGSHFDPKVVEYFLEIMKI